jgi:predicted small secreted protein
LKVGFMMMQKFSLRLPRILFAVLLCLFLSSCVSTVVGAAVDVSIEAAKVPFKVAGAAVDLAVPDGDED